MGDDRNQGQNEAEEAKTKADQGGTERRQGQREGKAKTTGPEGSQGKVESQNVLRHKHCRLMKDNTQTKHKRKRQTTMCK